MESNADDKRLTQEWVDEDLRGAADWAHSVQARLAEHLAGAIARGATGTEVEPVLRNELRQLAEQAGFNPEDLEPDPTSADRAKLSEFDEPTVRRLLQESIDRLSRTLSEAGLQTGGRKLLAWSLPSGEVNALCAANTWDDRHYHIFLDADLLTFCNSISKIFSECFAAGRTSGGEIGVSSHKIIAAARSMPVAARAADLFHSIVLLGTARASQPWRPTKDSFGLNLCLGQSIIDFVIGHELSHLIRGHLEAEDTRTVGIAELNEVNGIVYSAQAEFEADTLAAILSTQTAIATGYPNIFTAIAPYIFLRGIETLEYCNSIFEHPSAGLSFTHPSARERADRIRDVIKLHLEYHNSGKLLTEAVRRVDQISYWLRAAAAGYLQQRKAAGAIPRTRVRLRAVERGDPLDFVPPRAARLTTSPYSNDGDLATKIVNRTIR